MLDKIEIDTLTGVTTPILNQREMFQGEWLHCYRK